MLKRFYDGISNNTLALIAQLIAGAGVFVAPNIYMQLGFLLLCGAFAFCYEKEVEDEIQ